MGSSQVDSIVTVPGNGGTATLGKNLRVPLSDLSALAGMAQEQSVDLTVVGPETTLAAGIVDEFSQLGLPVFGPNKAAARIESSKSFAKELMQKYNIPHPDYKAFDSYADARSYIAGHSGPLVVKADGLAAGKGVFICPDQAAAQAAVYSCMEAKSFGPAGEIVVLEEYLTGQEVSVFAFSDGATLSSLVAACDYKRLHDGDEGPNTGGMGSYATPEFWTKDLEAVINDTIMKPTIQAFGEMSTPYKGVLYAGLMITDQGPQVLEYNCRFGDPEAQVILPLLKTDLIDAITASIEGRLHRVSVEWRQNSCVGVVVASGGYPGNYSTGIPIDGLEDVEQDVMVFHAGTKVDPINSGGVLVTDGGRVMTVVATGDGLGEARDKVYRNLGRIRFLGAHYRSDIASLRKAAAL